MLPYILIFTIVMILTIIAQVTYKKSRKLSIVISAICVLILSVFAGLRGLDVGIDISVYGERFFRYCKSFNTFTAYISAFNMERGYLAINYIVYKLFDNIHILLFILQAISASVVYMIAYREKEKGTMWLIILTYMCIWYNTTFNILRQSIAVAICLYAYKFMEDKKYLKYIIAIGIAFLFHKSALLCLIILAIGILSRSKIKNIYNILIIVGIIIVYNSLDKIVYLINGFLPFINKYLNYFNTDERIPNINWGFAIFKIIMLIGILIFAKKLIKKEKNIENKENDNVGNSILVTIAILDVLLYCSSSVIQYGYRASYYFLPHLIILCPRIDWSLKGYQTRIIYRIFIIVSLLLYWYFRYVAIGYDGTIPYNFYWR